MSRRTNQVFLPHNSPVPLRMVKYLSKRKFVLEIGCGDGAITELLKAKNFKYLGIEIDPKYVQKLSNLSMNVREKNALSLTTEEVRAGTQIIGSLPYDQSKAIILHLMLLTAQVSWSFCIFMIQKEVATNLTKGWWGDAVSHHFIHKNLFVTNRRAWNQHLKVDGTVILLINRNSRKEDLSLRWSILRNLWTSKKKKLRNNPNPKVGRVATNLKVEERRIHELSHKLRAQLLKELLLV